jgi:hypothetical protein
VGTVIGYLWRGKWCLRARPRYVHNPRTERQRAARGLFTQATQLASCMKQALRLGLHGVSLALHRTPCNHFHSINRECFALVDGRLEVDYENLVVAEGDVAPVSFGEPLISGAREVTVPFEKNPQGLRCCGDDTVYLYAWCPALGEGLLALPAFRRTGQATLPLPDRWACLEVHLYGFVTDTAGGASVSTYIGCGEVPSADEVSFVAAGGEEGGGEEGQQEEHGAEYQLYG